MITQVGDIFLYREAIRNLVARDLKVRYSNSILGVVWSLFSPLLMTVVYTLVFTILVKSDIENFPVFILAGLLPWNFLAGSIVGATSVIIANGHLINRVYFPREVLPISTVIANGVNFLIALLLLAGAIVLFQVRLSGTVLLMPILIAIQFVFTLGLALFLSAVNVFLRDTQQIVEVLMLAWFFLTPVIYPIEVIESESVRVLVQALNPMAALVVNYRHLLYYGDMPDLTLLAITSVEAAMMLVLGALVFQRLSPAFAEEM